MFTPAHYRHGRLNLQFLDVNGDGTGSIDMNIDGSVVPVDFRLLCPPGRTLYLEDVSVFIQDEGNFAAAGYGGIATLAVGTSLGIKTTSGMIVDVTDQLPIRSNSDWLAYAFKTESYDFSAGQSVLSFNYNLNSSGRPLVLGPGMEWFATVNDDLSALTAHRIRVSYIEVPINQ